MALYTNGSPGPASPATPPTPVKDISGRKLAKRLRRGMSPVFAALLAHDMETGRVRLHRLTRQQSCSVTGASWGYTSTLARATEEEVERVKRGELSLSALHNKPKSDPFKALANASNEVEAELGDESITVGDFIDRVFAKLGDGVLAAALDRLTAPVAINNNSAALEAAE
jgi:hypothetical protein